MWWIQNEAFMQKACCANGKLKMNETQNEMKMNESIT